MTDADPTRQTTKPREPPIPDQKVVAIQISTLRASIDRSRPWQVKFASTSKPSAQLQSEGLRHGGRVLPSGRQPAEFATNSGSWQTHESIACVAEASQSGSEPGLPMSQQEGIEVSKTVP
jgi:hypothetical protein